MPPVSLPLTQGFSALIDPEDYERLRAHKWCYMRRRNRSTGYAQSNIKVGGRWKRVLLHRFIMEAAPGTQIDHEDGNGLNCVRSNLRTATHADNMHNSRPRKGTSRFKGVCWHKAAGKWVAQIMKDRKHFVLGYYATEEEAAVAYDAAAKEMHGKFARTNF